MLNDDKPLQYESLIRAAYRKKDKTVSRYEKSGADADIYRRLAIDVAGGVSGVVNQTKIDKSVREITTHIRKALVTVRVGNGKDEAFIEKIDECLSLLDTPSKEKIDECIDKAWEAFRSIGLTVS